MQKVQTLHSSNLLIQCGTVITFWCGTRCCKQTRDVSGGKQVFEMTEEVN